MVLNFKDISTESVSRVRMILYQEEGRSNLCSLACMTMQNVNMCKSIYIVKVNLTSLPISSLYKSANEILTAGTNFILIEPWMQRIIYANLYYEIPVCWSEFVMSETWMY